MRVAVVGAGVAGLAAAIDLVVAGHDVVVLEAGAAPGGKCWEVVRGSRRWDAGPSLVTLPQVFEALFADSGAPLADELELLRVEPVTRYEFADGTTLELSADLPRALEALEGLAPGAGTDWTRLLGTCARMWQAAWPFLLGDPPWPPRRPRPGVPVPDPRDGLRVRPWQTLRQLGRQHVRDPRLRQVVDRFATYAGADPRRAPASTALAGYVEHAFGAWHPRGGVFELVRAMVRRFERLGGELRLAAPVRAVDVRHGRAQGVLVGDERVAADVVVAAVDEATVRRHLLPSAFDRRPTERSLSGFSLLLGLDGAGGAPHHRVRFPADYDAEFDDVFVHRRPARDPTLYVCAAAASDPSLRATDREDWSVLVNAPAGPGRPDWGPTEAMIVERLGVEDRVREVIRRTPEDLQDQTGAYAGAIYGAAPHGRLAAMHRPGRRIRGVDGLLLAGGTVHPGGGLPLALLGGRATARSIGAP